MHIQPSFNLEAILQTLKDLDIAHDVAGHSHDRHYRFVSLRHFEPEGICYIESLQDYGAKVHSSIILCSKRPEVDQDNTFILLENPKVAFYRLMQQLVPITHRKSGIHPTAIVIGECTIAPEASVGPYCVLEDCVIEAGVALHSHVVVMPGTTVEADVIVEPHSTLGATGVAWTWDPESGERVRQPQTGYTRIGRGAFLGSDISVVRGSVNETTRIGAGCVIAHGSKIGHGAQIGDECHLANNVSIAGNVSLGQKSFLGSGAIVRPNTILAERTIVAAGAVVVDHCRETGMLLVGCPATPKLPKKALAGVPRQLP